MLTPAPVPCFDLDRLLTRGVAALLVACAVFGPGCGGVGDGGDGAGADDDDGGDSGDDGDDGDDGAPDAGAGDAQPDGVLGDWVVTGGHILPLAGPTIRSVALRLDADGTGLTVFGGPSDDFVTCTPVTALLHDDSLVLNFAPAGYPVGQVFTISERDGETLTLFDGDGQFLFLSRPTEALPMPSCQMVEELSLHEDLPEPTSYSELEFDGSTLFYVSDEFPDPVAYPLRAVNAETGELITPPDAFYPPFIRAWQAGSFWATCGCGGDEEAMLTSAAGSTESINTTTLGNLMQVISMAVDLDADIAWIAARDPDPAGDFLLRVDTGVEPNALLETIALPEELATGSLAYDGSDLWTVVSVLSPALARIDEETGEIVDVWQLPAHGVRWGYVAIHDGRMFVLGTVGDDGGAIMEVTLPGQPGA